MFVNGRIVIHIFGTRIPIEKFILGKISSDQARNLHHYFIEDIMNLYLYEERKVIEQSYLIRTLCEQHYCYFERFLLNERHYEYSEICPSWNAFGPNNFSELDKFPS